METYTNNGIWKQEKKDNLRPDWLTGWLAGWETNI